MEQITIENMIDGLESELRYLQRKRDKLKMLGTESAAAHDGLLEDKMRMVSQAIDSLMKLAGMHE